MSIFGTAASHALGSLSADKQQQFNLQAMKEQYGHNEQMAKNNQQRNKDMWDYTNYENQRKHMEAANLNPGLMYGMSGGGGSSASGAQGGPMSAIAGGEVSAGAQMANMSLQAMQVKSAIDVNESIANKNNVEADKIAGVDTEKVKADIKLSGQLADTEEKKQDVLKEEALLKEAQTWLTNSKASTEQFNLQETQLRMNQIKESTLKLAEEVKLLKFQNKINSETAEIQIAQYEANYRNTIADTLTKMAQGQYYEDEAKAISERIRQGDEAISQRDTEILQKWVSVGIEGVDAVVGGLGTLGKLKHLKELLKFKGK